MYSAATSELIVRAVDDDVVVGDAERVEGVEQAAFAPG